MLSVVYALLAYVVSTFRSREALRLENMALRHQVAVYQRTVHRPGLRPMDHLFWSWLSRLWTGWQEALAFVQPRTILATPALSQPLEALEPTREARPTRDRARSAGLDPHDVTSQSNTGLATDHRGTPETRY